MQYGHGSIQVTRALDSLYGQLLQQFHPADPREAGIQTAIMTPLDLLTQAREERLARASGTVPGIIWFVLFVGAVLAIGFTFFFGTPNAAAQALMTGALCLLILFALLIVITVDRPFTGSVVVTPEPLAEVLADFRAPPAP
jgi:protein-S-isoprenylcysteine O-methyltransferase Ste14